MKTIFLCFLFPVSCLCCENCIEEIVKQNKEVLNELTHYEGYVDLHDACLFYYYAGRAESLTEAVKIMKKNH